MTRRLLASYLTLAVVLLVLLEIPLGVVFGRLQRTTLFAGLRADAAALADDAEQRLNAHRVADLPAIAADYRRQTGDGRVTITDATGTVFADSEPAEPGVQNFSSRPEISAALAGRAVTGSRYSRTLHTRLYYAVAPIRSARGPIGAVRVSYPSGFVDGRVRRTWLLLGVVGLVVVAGVSVLSLVLARGVGRPLGRLQRAAERLGAGDLAARAEEPPGPPEVTQLARRFNDMAERLERLVASQRSFVADASHQLRTPLAAMQLRLELLADEVEPAGRADLEGALREAERLSRLVDGLLALARADRQAAAPERVDVALVVADRRAAWTPLADESGVTLSVDVSGTTCVTATAGHLEQVLDNLLANALEVSPRGSTVTIRVTGASPWVDVHVLDEGPGMPADERAAALDRFWRSGRARATASRLGGSGLGLAIVAQLVGTDGGWVRLDEAPGGGLDARVRLRGG